MSSLECQIDHLALAKSALFAYSMRIMAHPFVKMFDQALKKSSTEDNQVLVEAEKIIKKGYSATEVFTVLTKLQKSLIDNTESELVGEAAEEVSRYL